MTHFTKHALFFSLFLVAQVCNAQQDETKQIQTVINRFFQGMKVSDTTLVRSCFVSTPHLLTTFTRKGVSELHEESFKDFLKAIATPPPSGEEFNEVLESFDIKVDGSMAAAWTPYKFYIGKTFSHCGVNNFQLFKSPEGWKIVGIMDTRRKADCEK